MTINLPVDTSDAPLRVHVESSSDNTAADGPATAHAQEDTPVPAPDAPSSTRKRTLHLYYHVILPHEDRALFEALVQTLRDTYQPQCSREAMAVEEIAKCAWALRRFDKAESFALAFPTPTHSPRQDEVPAAHKLDYIAVLSDQPGKAHSAFTGIHQLLRYRDHWDRRHQRAMRQFDAAQRARLALLREQRQAAAEARKEEDAQRKRQVELDRQQHHALRCELLQLRIARESQRPARRTKSVTPETPTAAPIHEPAQAQARVAGRSRFKANPQPHAQRQPVIARNEVARHPVDQAQRGPNPAGRDQASQYAGDRNAPGKTTTRQASRRQNWNSGGTS